MHDDEPDTFERKDLTEVYSEMLVAIDVKSAPKDLGSDYVERGDYYSRYYPNSPRMITNRGCIDLVDSNIDLVQLVQKG